ncbi:MAG TPA: RES family NAD+ phosphorylase [Acidobacteriota bacterium]|nr:RES family NAD+ phosphorylase [Acidobacteriota bacterium]
MPEAWRVVKAKHVATAFSGEGAAKAGGRWNSRGVSVVYTSSSRSLAVLETLVHLIPPVTFHYKIIRVTFTDTMVEPVKAETLPSDWQAEPPPLSTKQLGDEWVRSGRSAVLAVPSVIIRGEINYLLNAAHPEFKKISIGKPADFTFDPRLLS